MSMANRFPAISMMGKWTRETERSAASTVGKTKREYRPQRTKAGPFASKCFENSSDRELRAGRQALRRKVKYGLLVLIGRVGVAFEPEFGNYRVRKLHSREKGTLLMSTDLSFKTSNLSLGLTPIPRSGSKSPGSTLNVIPSSMMVGSPNAMKGG